MSSKAEQDRFAKEIRRLAKESGNDLMETVLEYCVQKGLDPSSIGKLINKGLKMQIAREANTKNLLRKSRRRS